MGTLSNDNEFIICRNYIPGNVWQSCVAFLNDLNWYLDWQEVDGKWYLLLDNQPIFIGNSWEELEAFVYGIVLKFMATKSF